MVATPERSDAITLVLACFLSCLWSVRKRIRRAMRKMVGHGVPATRDRLNAGLKDAGLALNPI